MQADTRHKNVKSALLEEQIQLTLQRFGTLKVDAEEGREEMLE